MGLKNFLIVAACTGAIFASGSSIREDYIRAKNCVSDLELVEFSVEKFEDLVNNDLDSSFLKRINLENKINTALVVSHSLDMLDVCRINNGFENYSSEQSSSVKGLARDYRQYYVSESTKLNSDILKLYGIDRLKSDIIVY
jgi:hypothetical protein